MKQHHILPMTLIGLVLSLGPATAQPPTTIKNAQTPVVRLNPLSATLKNEASLLKDGTYSVVSLRLPGSSKASDYYVKRAGTKLILNGDIIVYDFAVQSTMSYSRNDNKPLFGTDQLYRWPNGTVPVVLDKSVFQADYYLIIKSALDFYNFNTGIVFKEHTNETEWLYITVIDDDGSGRGGSTEVGRQRGGANILNLTKGKFAKQTVLHELLHTLGFFHEQARPDRDNFISIQWANIPSARTGDFQMEDNGTAHGSYDYCSIMQYPSMAFSSNGNATIVCKTNGTVTKCPDCMGTSTDLTRTDLDGLDEFYRGIGISRFPSQTPFVASQVPITGCVSVSDPLIRAKWDYYKPTLGDCLTGQITLALFGTNYVTYEHGQIYHSPHGVNAIYGDIYQLFTSTNGMGNFGLPLTDESDIHDEAKGLSSWAKAGYTRVSTFEKGAIVWGPAQKARGLTTEQYTAGPHPLTRPATQKVNEVNKVVTPPGMKTRITDTIVRRKINP